MVEDTSLLDQLISDCFRNWTLSGGSFLVKVCTWTRKHLCRMWVILVVSIVALAESKSVDVNIIQDSSHWEKLANFTVSNSDTVVSKYKSSLTGNILPLV